MCRLLGELTKNWNKGCLTRELTKVGGSGHHRPMAPLIACPACACPVKSFETDCPHCGKRMRGNDGGVPRTAAALLLGLVIPLAAVAAGCGDDTSGNGGSGGTGGSGGSTNEGAGGTTNEGGGTPSDGGAGAGGSNDGGGAAFYGVPGSGGGGGDEGGFAADYGVPGTGAGAGQ